MPSLKRKKDDSAVSEHERRSASKGTTFEELQLPERDHSKLLPQTLHYLHKKRGLVTCSPVQEVVIPAFSASHDVAVEACTGSGKTLSYLIPVIERLWLKIATLAVNGDVLDVPVGATLQLACIGGVIIAPSRELVTQIAIEAKDFVAAFKEWEDQHLKTPEDTTLSQYNLAKYRPANRLFSIVFSGGRGLKEDKDLLQRVAARQAKACGELSLGIMCITAGRFRSHLTSEDTHSIEMNKDWTLKTVEVLVVDEADRFFNDSNSTAQLMDCLSHLPRQRRTGIFSATLTREYQSLEDCGLRNPMVMRLNITKDGPSDIKKSRKDSKTEEAISDADTYDASSDVESSSPEATAISTTTHQLPARLTNMYVVLEHTQRLAFLLKLLNTFKGNKAIIFFTTCSMVNFYQTVLSDLIAANSKARRTPSYLDVSTTWLFAALHGQFGKPKRRKAIRLFNSTCGTNEKHVLLASDLGARGLDFADVDLIVQFDAPSDPAMCIHRMGRTARAGKSGTAVLCLSPTETDYIEYLKTLGVSLVRATDSGKSLARCKQWRLPVGSEDTWQWPVEGKISMEDLSVQKPRISEPGNHSKIDSFVNSEECTSLLKWIKVATFRDKDLATKARDAFVSMVRSYKEHKLRFIFVFLKLDYGLLATSLALSRLPRISELKACPTIPFEDDFAMDFREVAFQDARLEARHKCRLEKARIKRSEKLAKLKEIRQSKLKSKVKRVTKAKKRIVNALNEAEANIREQRLYSKVKKGLISQKEFDKLVGNEVR